MKSKQLREMQAPLKEKYRSEPGSAIFTLKAASTMNDGISCKIDTGKAMIEAGLHPGTGGDGTFICSGDMLLEALAACAGVTLKSVATAIDFDLQDVTILVEGDIDFRGTLSVDREAPVGFKAIRMTFDLLTGEPMERIDTLIRLTERYCIVFQTLTAANHIDVEVTAK